MPPHEIRTRLETMASWSFKWRRANCTRLFPNHNNKSCKITAEPLPMVVATAAPLTPSSGKGPIPKMNKDLV